MAASLPESRTRGSSGSRCRRLPGREVRPHCPRAFLLDEDILAFPLNAAIGVGVWSATHSSALPSPNRSPQPSRILAPGVLASQEKSPDLTQIVAQDDLVRTVAQTDATLENDSMTLRLRP
jgi:hypothetical protein